MKGTPSKSMKVAKVAKDMKRDSKCMKVAKVMKCMKVVRVMKRLTAMKVGKVMKVMKVTKVMKSMKAMKVINVMKSMKAMKVKPSRPRQIIIPGGGRSSVSLTINGNPGVRLMRYVLMLYGPTKVTKAMKKKAKQPRTSVCGKCACCSLWKGGRAVNH